VVPRVSLERNQPVDELVGHDVYELPLGSHENKNWRVVVEVVIADVQAMAAPAICVELV
jgi:hypothetical protein